MIQLFKSIFNGKLFVEKKSFNRPTIPLLNFFVQNRQALKIHPQLYTYIKTIFRKVKRDIMWHLRNSRPVFRPSFENKMLGVCELVRSCRSKSYSQHNTRRYWMK